MVKKRSRQRLRPATGFVLRTPLLPVEILAAWAGRGGADDAAVRSQRGQLAELLSIPAVEEALLVASPSLHADLPVWRDRPDSARGRRVERALVKYVARMAARATPFGLFSGISTGRVTAATHLVLGPRAGYRRRTRIDNDFVFAWTDAAAREPAVRARLTFWPNGSLYAIGEQLRYAEARLHGTERSYHLVSVERTGYLDATLARARDGASRAALIAGLAGDHPDVETAEIEAFVDELIDAQLLVSDLGVSVTGPEPIDHVIDRLEHAGAGAPADIWMGVRARLEALDAPGPRRARRADYEDVAAALAGLPAAPPIELSRLLQVDMVKPAPGLSLAGATVRSLADAAEALATITPAGEDPALEAFRSAFRERCEDRELPLTEVLDEESGIGFDPSRAPGAEGSPLLEGVALGGAGRPRSVPWGAREHWLLARVMAGDDELVLDDAALAALAPEQPATLPDAYAIMARIAAPSVEAAARGELDLLLEHAGGPSGARLLGRFCHASPETDALVRDHLRAEEALAPDAIFAEIAHLHEGRIGNVQCRPVLRGHEIPFLGISGAPPDRRIGVDDLLVSVRGNEVILRSRRLGRRVIPRLSTAHNFQLRTLGTYRLLCALQGQDGRGVSWSWGPLADAPRLPRVRIGGVCVARARWRLDAREVAAVAAAVPAGIGAVFDAVSALRAARGLPRFVALADGDNELPVDLDNALLVDAFGKQIAGRRGAALVEPWPTPARAAVSGPEGRFACELIVPLVRAPAADTAPEVAPRPAATPVVRRFVPGSEWLFVKLYVGVAGADRVLTEVAWPVARAAMARAAGEPDELPAAGIRSWFFLRYGDPHHHVRARFRGRPEVLLGEILPALHARARPFVDAGVVWKIQLDTYEREVERYGGPNGIALAEELFCVDSEAVCAVLALLDGDAGLDARWRLGVRGADHLLADLGLDPQARARIFDRAARSFAIEHALDTAGRKKLGERFRSERAALAALLADPPDPAHPLAAGLAAIDSRRPALRALAARLAAAALTAPVEEIAWSYVHMHLNRIFHAAPRAQEMVLYDLLARHHAGRRAREKAR